MPNPFDGYYYRKPWVKKPGQYDSFNLSQVEGMLAQQPRFDGNAPMNPKNDIFDLPDKWSYNGPWTSNEQRLTQQALMAASIPGTELQALVRPPLPQIRMMPPRFGYGAMPQPGIEDVVTIDRTYVEPRVSWYSGSPAGYSGTSRNSLEGV